MIKYLKAMWARLRAWFAPGRVDTPTPAHPYTPPAEAARRYTVRCHRGLRNLRMRLSLPRKWKVPS